jgi:hypothetical protein
MTMNSYSRVTADMQRRAADRLDAMPDAATGELARPFRDHMLIGYAKRRVIWGYLTLHSSFSTGTEPGN